MISHLPFPSCVYEELVQCLFALVGNSSSHEKRITQKNTEKLAFVGCALYIKMMLLTPGHWGNFSISSWLQLPNLGNKPDTIASSRMIARDIKCCGYHFFFSFYCISKSIICNPKLPFSLNCIYSLTKQYFKFKK